MDKVNWTKLEEKWRQRWIKEKDFEAEPDSREKKFITVAYPVPKEIVKGFVEPIKIADYFSAEIKQGMIEMGYFH